jgi:hypothetical protein
VRDPALPIGEKIEALIGSEELRRIFEVAPDRFRLLKVGDDLDARDAACSRPRWRVCRPAFDRGSHGHRETCFAGIVYIFGFSRPLQRSVNKE